MRVQGKMAFDNAPSSCERTCTYTYTLIFMYLNMGVGKSSI